ncbi:protein of unknown function [Chryseobacterium rhizoplanae]|uniref:DUF4280 domain-containing protein n=1 Tax=Chryseobacterium rhizoplanae TaxID=1609531 RepID=A0A521DLM4_9FLAO|nr:DUF4280 domain-containing protein [Chryseobacterium rhizoplanae]SMO72624.1 protein of unknown function [Chryseobacterium rhizoplanae]
MPEIITERASLLCDKGVTPSLLKVTSNCFYQADNKLIATEEDKQTEINIGSFGICTVTKIKCIPVIAKWENTAKDTCINNHKVLTEKSTCHCGTGGKISVTNKGHCEKHDVE